jgi:hypothetical protein
MWRRQIAAMYLLVALRAVAVECTLHSRTRADIHQPRPSVWAEVRAHSVSGMAPQAQECRGLLQQIVFNSAVCLMADRAILRHRWVLVDERPVYLHGTWQTMLTVASFKPSTWPCGS